MALGDAALRGIIDPPPDHPLIGPDECDPVATASREILNSWAGVSAALRLDLAQATEDVSIALAAGRDAVDEVRALNDMRAAHAAAHERAATAARAAAEITRDHQAELDRLAEAGDVAYSEALARGDIAAAEAIWREGMATAAGMSERACFAVVTRLNSACFDMSLTRRNETI